MTSVQSEGHQTQGKVSYGIRRKYGVRHVFRIRMSSVQYLGTVYLLPEEYRVTKEGRGKEVERIICELIDIERGKEPRTQYSF